MKIKILEELKKNKYLLLMICLVFFTYILFRINHKFIFIYIFSLFGFIYTLINIYYKNTLDMLEYGLLTFFDISYTFLGTFDIKYILMYIIMALFCIYIDSKKLNNNESIYVVIEFITVYTIFKILLFISMILA